MDARHKARLILEYLLFHEQDSGHGTVVPAYFLPKQRREKNGLALRSGMVFLHFLKTEEFMDGYYDQCI